MFHELANERIAFQHNSTLASRITTICQDALDHVQSTKKVNKADYSRIRSVSKYLDKDFSPALIKIVDEELNLRISKIEIITSRTPYMNAYMWPEFKGDSGWGALDAEEMFSGTLAKENATAYKDNIFSALKNKVDLEVGKLKEKTDRYSIGIGLYTSVFVANELHISEALSAREIAAIILHELGHGLTMLEHCADQYYRADAMKDTITLLQSSKNDNLKESLYENSKAYIENSQSGFIKDNKDKIDDILSALKNTHGGVIASAGTLFLTVLLILIIGSVIVTFSSTLLFGMLITFASGSFKQGNLGGKKTSDLVVTKTNISYVEHIADEFVSRHGLGDALSAALSKAYIHHEEGQSRNIATETLTSFYMGQMFLKTLSIYKAFFGGSIILMSYTYNPDLDRLKLLLENNMTVFKDLDMPKDMSEKYIKSTKELISTIDSYSSRTIVKVKDLFWGTMSRIITRHGLIDAITTGNVSADYDTLQKLTNGLIRNPLYFHAARLKALSEKK